MEKIVLNRKELYDQLWSEPASSLLKKYNLTYPDLKKICNDLCIPRPENGYWLKMEFGKDVVIHPLPSDYSGEQNVTLVLKDEGDQGTERLSSPLSIQQKEIEKDNRLALIVPGRLTNPDKLIIAAREDLNDKTYLHDGLTNTSRGKLNIRVSPDNVSRALRFMDVLIKNLQSRGHVVSVDQEATCVVIHEERIKISLREKLKRTAVPSNSSWQQYEFSPTGILIFSIQVSYQNIEWKDGKIPLEEQLSRIIAKLELEAKERNEIHLEREQHRAEEKAKQRLRDELEEQKRKELSAFNELLKESERWHQAKTLRDYIDAVEAKAISNNKMSEELKSWLAWARKKADWLDPSMKMEDEVHSN